MAPPAAAAHHLYLLDTYTYIWELEELAMKMVLDRLFFKAVCVGNMAETCLDDGRCWGTSSGRGEREWDGALVWRHATSDVPKSAAPAAASHTYPMLHTQNSYIYIYTCICTHHPHTRGAYINIGEREREKNVYPLIYPPHTYIDLLSPFFSRIFSFLFCLSWFLSSFSERYVIRNRLSVIARLTTARQSQQLRDFLFLLLNSASCAAVVLFLELFSICGRDYTSEIVRGGRNQPTYREFVSDDGRAQGEWVYRLG
jgi:hypothetical protein